MFKVHCMPIIAVALSAAGAASAQTTAATQDLSSLVVHCAAPVARVTIGTISCKAQACQETAASNMSGPMQALMAMAAAQGGAGFPQSYPGFGKGMGNALATALKTTGCVEVMEREDMEELQKEAELSGVKLQPKAADFVVSGAITALNLETKTSTIGGGLIPVVGGVSRTNHKAQVTLDMRVIDVKAATIKDSRSFTANNTQADWGLGGFGYGGSGGLFGTSSATQSPELDSVANRAILEAANFVAESIAGAAITSRPAPPAPSAKSR